MAQCILLDSDVLIDLNRGRPQAVQFVLRLPVRPIISAVTVVELYSGVRGGSERNELELFIGQSNVIEVDLQIAERVGLIKRQYFKSHGTGFADAVIAATAETLRGTLVTLNRKHFPMLPDVLVPYQKA